MVKKKLVKNGILKRILMHNYRGMYLYTNTIKFTIWNSYTPCYYNFKKRSSQLRKITLKS